MGVASLYTKEMARKIRDIKPPYKGINFDLVDRKDFITIRIREDEIMQFSDMQKISIMEYLQQVRSMIESFGIRCEFEGIPYRGTGT